MCGSNARTPVCITVDAIPVLRVRSTIAVVLARDLLASRCYNHARRETRDSRLIDRGQRVNKGNRFDGSPVLPVAEIVVLICYTRSNNCLIYIVVSCELRTCRALVRRSTRKKRTIKLLVLKSIAH